MHGFTQKELVAHRLFTRYGVRAKLALSAPALRIARTRTQASAGLRELQAATYPTVHRGFMQSDAEFAAELQAMRAEVHAGAPIAAALMQHGFGVRHIA